MKRYWELERLTGRKEYRGAFRDVEQALCFLNTLLDEFGLTTDDKIAAEGTPLQLKNTYTGDFITLYNTPKEQVERLKLPYETIRDAVRVAVPDTRAATQLILAHPEIFTDYEIAKGKMDDVFLAVTGKTLVGGDAAKN